MTDPDDGYQGPAFLLVEDTEIDVSVTLRGHFQPIDGRYHWYGRIRADERLHRLAGGRKLAVTIRTPGGEARGDVSDPDTWGRYRIAGTSTPPFARTPSPDPRP